jgi:hypothetical protein
LYGADDYQIVQQPERIDVIPAQVLKRNGSKNPVVPVMSHAVSFPTSERTVEETLVMLLKEVSKASGKKITLMSDPYTALSPKVAIGADNEVPGDVISKIGESIGATLSYQCLFDASDSTYYVNIYPVVSSIQGTLYNNKTPGQDRSKLTGGGFFTKDLP